MEEEFKDIPGYEGIYQISKNGEVKSLSRCVNVKNGKVRKTKEKILKNVIRDKNYYCVTLCKKRNKKIFNIHQLVYLTYYGEYDKKYYHIDHIDKNPKNNNYLNIHIVSIRDNQLNRIDNNINTVGGYKSGNKYHSCIHINGKQIWLGSFETQDDATNKYLGVKHQIEEIEKVTRNYDFNRIKKEKEYFIELFAL